MNPNQEENHNELDLVSLAKQLSQENEKTSWRSLQELARTSDFMEHLKKEYPRHAQDLTNLNRRDFLKLLSASLALAGLSGCIPQPTEKIVPYVNAPQEITPNRNMYYATAMEVDGFARGLLVKSTMGRPIKAEGNPEHPASLGRTDVLAQASLLDLYDPDRAQVVRHQGRISTWDAFLAALLNTMNSLSTKKGAGLRILSGPVTSPTLTAQMNALMVKFPQARWIQYSPVDRNNIYSGTQMAFGQRLNPVYRFDQAQTILSIDDDFTLLEPGWIRYSHDFIDRRRVLNGKRAMNRLYSVDTSLTNTGAMADHHMPLHPRQIDSFVRTLAQQLGVAGINGQSPVPNAWMSALVDDLKASLGQSLVIVGQHHSAQIHALVFAINNALGNIGKTIYFTQPVEAVPQNGSTNLSDLVNELNQGQVEVLLVLDQNAVYNAPADLDFSKAYQKAKTSVYLSLYEDETAALSTWFIPAAHFLEAWGDTRAYDGTVSIIQPLIEPLYGGKTGYEILSAMLGQPQANNYDLIQNFWVGQTDTGGMLAQTISQNPIQQIPAQAATQTTETPSAQSTPNAATQTPLPMDTPVNIPFQKAWEISLKNGVVIGTALPAVNVALALNLGNANQPNVDTSQPVLVFEPDSSIWDGRWANNGWLQELPKRLTKLTWDNAALISPALASKMNLNDEDVVQLQIQGRAITAPVFILPGQPEKSITVHLGYGRQRGGQVLSGHGFNAYQLRTSDSPWFGYNLKIQKTGETYKLATTQHHQSMDGRDLVRAGNIQDYVQKPEMFRNTNEEQPTSLYPPIEYTKNKWGMSIDVNACIGCNACVTACQAENNIPVVGKEQVLSGREMHWIRIDRYFEGNDLNQPRTLFAPVPCMQCEDAPCEYVCPVEATQHDEEGLNEQIYNRCIGTRYCSQNCPYKVRRFNFLQYADLETNSLKMLRNPEVTVRFRGVMEKCTYCVQRIRNAEIDSEVQGRPLVDGSIQTACQQVCPTNAIVFGDLNQTDSQVSQLKKEPRDYAMLAELGTRPRTTYLAKLRNPNPKIQETESQARK